VKNKICIAVWILIGFISLAPLVCSPLKAQLSVAIDFDNVIFISDWTKSGEFQFTRGEYRESAAPGAATEIVVRLTGNIVVEKIDGKDVAVVILITDPGGSGTFYDLALLIKGPQDWVNTNVVHLGDRVKIHSLAIKNDMIVVDMTTHGPDDPMCCPSRRVIQRYAMENDRFVKANDFADKIEDSLFVGTVWKWQQTLYNNDMRAVPGDPSRYTIAFQPDGSLNIRADCNRAGGKYLLQKSALTIEVTHSTRAACPPDSLEQTFLRDLNAAAIYFMREGHLYIDLKYDTGTMKFAK
jgi:heat shock protein HslJ